MYPQISKNQTGKRYVSTRFGGDRKYTSVCTGAFVHILMHCITVSVELLHTRPQLVLSFVMNDDVFYLRRLLWAVVASRQSLEYSGNLQKVPGV